MFPSASPSASLGASAKQGQALHSAGAGAPTPVGMTGGLRPRSQKIKAKGNVKGNGQEVSVPHETASERPHFSQRREKWGTRPKSTSKATDRSVRSTRDRPA